ncbi:MAG: hypothetical protein H6Q71_1155 [Firmicutes bacterium]|nr:hypothetical protein [Bacillota bacterium]
MLNKQGMLGVGKQTYHLNQQEVITVHDKKDKHEAIETIFAIAVFQNIAEQVRDAIFVFDVYGKVMYTNRAASNVYGYSADEFHYIRVQDLYSPEERHIISDQMKVVGQEDVLFQVVHLRRDGTHFPVEISFKSTLFAGKDAFVSIVRDLSRTTEEKALKRSEKKYQLLHEELLAAHEELTASEEELRQQFDELLTKEEKLYRQNVVLNLLHDIALDLIADLNHDDILKKIISGAMEIFSVPNSFVQFMNEENGTFSLKKGTGVFAEFEYEGTIAEGLFGQVYKTGRIAVVDNYSTWEHRLPESVFDEVHYFVLVPLKNRDRIIGTIGLAFSESGRIFDDYELSLFQRFADLASLALNNAALVASLNNEIKERKQMEEHLRQSEEKFYKIYQMSPSAICVARQDGTYANVNESFCRSTGYTKEELIGKTRAELNLWVDARDKDFLLKGLKNHGEVNNVEAWYRRKDGRKLCGLMSARVVSINDEECILSVTQDITEQRKIEEQLKLSEEKFSQAFYLSPDTITITRMDGTYVEINEGFTQMSGYAKEEVIGKKTVELDLWADHRDRERMVEGLKSLGEIRNMEVRFRHKDGHAVYGQFSARVLNIDGEPYYIVVVRDITERVRAEEERRQQEEAILASKNKLSLAAELANLGPWEYNPETGLFEFGDEFYAVYGTDVEREGRFMSLDAYVREFVHSEDAWMFRDEKEFLSSGKQLNSSDVEHRIIRRDGEVRTVVVRRSVVRDAKGKIIRAYGTNQNITERVRAEEERRQQAEIIRHMAYFDSLTGLPNRHHLNEWLNTEMEQTREGSASGFVLFIDLDDLKMVNDTYGHTYGDEIIIAAGSRIVAGVGEDAFVARLGGDEFVVILHAKNNRGQIDEIVYRINKALGKKHEIFGTYFHMTASVGIAAYPADGDTTEEIIKNADNAMYAAKRDGKNCWRFYAEAMQTEAYEKMRLTNGLRYALELGELSLAYQPQIVTAEGTVVGFEALLRWNSSEHGAVAPIQFIPLAEQSGLIHVIGKWVLHEACRFARRLANQGWVGIHVAVNISSKQLAAADFIDIVRNAVKAAGIQPHQLELEITESLLMTSLEDATSKLAQLKALGVRLSLDDFGTGYSSLTYLRNLPVETLKIDKSFIDMITTDAYGAKIIGSIIDMAHTLNMTVVAEGVETEQQLVYLASNGCDRIQGYIFSRPIPEPEAIKFLTGRVC